MSQLSTVAKEDVSDKSIPEFPPVVIMDGTIIPLVPIANEAEEENPKEKQAVDADMAHDDDDIAVPDEKDEDLSGDKAVQV